MELQHTIIQATTEDEVVTSVREYDTTQPECPVLKKETTQIRRRVSAVAQTKATEKIKQSRVQLAKQQENQSIVSEKRDNPNYLLWLLGVIVAILIIKHYLTK